MYPESLASEVALTFDSIFLAEDGVKLGPVRQFAEYLRCIAKKTATAEFYAIANVLMGGIQRGVPVSAAAEKIQSFGDRLWILSHFTAEELIKNCSDEARRNRDLCISISREMSDLATGRSNNCVDSKTETAGKDLTMKKDLLKLLHDLSFVQKKVVLKSGRESNFYIDCKRTVLTPRGHYLVGCLMFALVQQKAPWAGGVAGVELGGCPMASAVSTISYNTQKPLSALYVRKDRKEHGMKKLVEAAGDVLGELDNVVLLEDVITTGGSTIRAAKALQEEGYQVAHIVVLVDRQEGGGEAIREAGFDYTALFTKQDFLPDGDL